jgi:hypothetical protein
MPIDVGSTVEARWTRGPDHANETGVTLTVTRPDGTLLTPAPSVTEKPAASGTYIAPFVAGLPGRYVLTWDAGTIRYTDVVSIWPSDPRFLVSLDAAIQSLRWPDAIAAKNADLLRLYVAAATEVIEDIVGAVLVRTIVQPSDGGRTGIALWERPSSIVSVTVGGQAYTGHVPNLNAGIVYADGGDGRFPDGRQNVVVTYRTGFESIPPSIQLGTLELIRHLWQVGQQALTGDGSPSYDPTTNQTTNTRSGFAVPNRVIELCGNHYALPGMA